MEYYIIMCQTIPSCRYEVGIQYRERKLFDKEVVKSDRKFFDDVKITDLHNSEMFYPPPSSKKTYNSDEYPASELSADFINEWDNSRASK